MSGQILTSTSSLSKFSADGMLQWAKTWGGSGDDRPGALALDGAGSLYIPGQFQHTVASRFNGSSLQVYYWDAQAGVWQASATTLDADTRMLTAQASRPGMFAVLGGKGPNVFLPSIRR